MKIRAQALRRLVMFGFPSDARTLQQVPAVVQVRHPALFRDTAAAS